MHHVERPTQIWYMIQKMAKCQVIHIALSICLVVPKDFENRFYKPYTKPLHIKRLSIHYWKKPMQWWPMIWICLSDSSTAQQREYAQQLLGNTPDDNLLVHIEAWNVKAPACCYVQSTTQSPAQASHPSLRQRREKVVQVSINALLKPWLHSVRSDDMRGDWQSKNATVIYQVAKIRAHQQPGCC